MVASGATLVVAETAAQVTSNPSVAHALPSPSGTTSDSVSVGDLVYQNVGVVGLATSANINRPAMGVVTLIDGTTVYHQPISLVRGLTIAGTPSGDHSAIYLATAGGLTFDAPTGGAGAAILQRVGCVIQDNGDSTYDAVLNASHAPVLV